MICPKFNLDVGYSITKVNLNPDNIKVTGPKNLLANLNHIDLNYKNELPIRSILFKNSNITKKEKLKLQYY